MSQTAASFSSFAAVSSYASFPASTAPPAAISGSASFEVSAAPRSDSTTPTGTISKIARIPLTTIYTPPAWCNHALFTYSTEHSGIQTFWRAANSSAGGPRSHCYPSGFEVQHNPTISAEYSPGVCPSGYTGNQVASETNTHRPQTSFCCRRDMTYVENTGCFSTVTTPTVVMLNSEARTRVTTPFVAMDWYVKVAWASDQLNEFEPRSAPLLPMFTIPASNGSNITIPTHPPIDRDPPSLPVGAKAGVGAGLTILVMAVFATGVYALWRRKRRRPAMDAQETSESGGSSDMAENSPGQHVYFSGPRHAQTADTGSQAKLVKRTNSQASLQETGISRQESWQTNETETQPSGGQDQTNTQRNWQAQGMPSRTAT